MLGFLYVLSGEGAGRKLEGAREGHKQEWSPTQSSFILILIHWEALEYELFGTISPS